MPNNTAKRTFTHLSLEQRIIIEQMLNEGKSIKAIGRAIGRHPSTVKREIVGRAEGCNKGAIGRILNRCIYRTQCDKFQLCSEKLNCTRKCSLCSLCNKVCPDFKEEFCPQFNNPPYVCNGCKKIHQCVLRKIFYSAKAAQKDYRINLVSTREGVNLTTEEIQMIDQIVSPGILNGQAIHHIVATNKDRLIVSDKTIYRGFSRGLFTAKNGDLRRRCRNKPRRCKEDKKKEHKIDKKCRINRTIEDYNRLFEDTFSPPPRILMDTVHGSKTKRALLTIHFAEFHFMIAKLIPDKTSASVINAFNELEDQLGHECFKRLFPAILTDNGSEFSNPSALEYNADHQPRTAIYYCDPMNSNQKAEIETNHKFLRYYFPKGSSFTSLTQADVDLMLSHINSYTRKALGDSNPAKDFIAHYGKETFDKLNQTLIPGDQITLNLNLFNE